MYTPGNILLVHNYIFEDGGEPKDKFFIVLWNEGSDTILGTLTTSHTKIPIEYIHPGIISFGILNTFHFPKKWEIGIDGFYFKLDTYIRFQKNIREKTIEGLMREHPGGIKLLSTLKMEWFNELLRGVKESKMVPKEERSKIRSYVKRRYKNCDYRSFADMLKEDYQYDFVPV